MALGATAAPEPVRLGLRENWRQFVLLLVVNACVGGMVGLERTVVPLIGAQEFHLADTALITSFIVSFGRNRGRLPGSQVVLAACLTRSGKGGTVMAPGTCRRSPR